MLEVTSACVGMGRHGATSACLGMGRHCAKTASVEMGRHWDTSTYRLSVAKRNMERLWSCWYWRSVLIIIMVYFKE